MKTLSEMLEKINEATQLMLEAADAIKEGIKPAFEHATEEIKALQESMRKETGGKDEQ